MVHGVREASVQEIARTVPGIRASDLQLAFVLDGEESAAAFKAEPFDSELLGLKIGRITALSARSASSYNTLLSTLLQRVQDEGYAQVLRRTGIERLEEIWALGHHGFELMDVGVVFGRTLSSVLEAAPHADLSIREASDADVQAIVRQMVSDPWGSRYEADPSYSAERVRALRASWLSNSHRGRAAFLVGVLDRQPAGYVTCLLDTTTRHGEIELVGTLPAHRGRKVASRILEHALAWFSTRASFVTVRTQATNYAAAALYEKSGFTLHASDVTFRRTAA